MADLSDAMSTTSPPAIYAAFGSKTGCSARSSPATARPSSPTARPRSTRPPPARSRSAGWQDAVEATTRRNRPKGCLLVQGALATSDAAADARRRRAACAEPRRRRCSPSAPSAPPTRATLPAGTDPRAAAEYVATFSRGSPSRPRRRIASSCTARWWTALLRRLPWEYRTVSRKSTMEARPAPARRTAADSRPLTTISDAPASPTPCSARWAAGSADRRLRG